VFDIEIKEEKEKDHIKIAVGKNKVSKKKKKASPIKFKNEELLESLFPKEDKSSLIQELDSNK
jgi:hypothetical protein